MLGVRFDSDGRLSLTGRFGAFSARQDWNQVQRLDERGHGQVECGHHRHCHHSWPTSRWRKCVRLRNPRPFLLATGTHAVHQA